MGHSHSHEDSHSHDHDHSGIFHSHAPAGKMKQAFFLAMIILAAELVFGILSNSLALLADAWHMATDVAAIGLSWFALVQAQKPPNQKMTFGYERAGIIAAAINGLTLVAITVWILYSAVERIMKPETVGGLGMLTGAAIGLVVNLFIIFRLNGGEDNLNVKAALLHVIGDVGASAGVIIAAIVIYFTGWQFIDPILSVFIAIIVAFSAWNITHQSFRILMQATPKDVDISDIGSKIKTVTGVKGVHDLHVWTLTSGKNVLTCHAVLNDNIQLNDSQTILAEIKSLLKSCGIQHTTIQIEDSSHSHDEQLVCKEIQNNEHSHQH
jgi:cobalt-zinc-cadmium efflux system protein